MFPMKVLAANVCQSCGIFQESYSPFRTCVSALVFIYKFDLDRRISCADYSRSQRSVFLVDFRDAVNVGDNDVVSIFLSDDRFFGYWKSFCSQGGLPLQRICDALLWILCNSLGQILGRSCLLITIKKKGSSKSESRILSSAEFTEYLGVLA